MDFDMLNYCLERPTKRAPWEVYEEIMEDSKLLSNDYHKMYEILCDDLRYARDHKAKCRGCKDY